MSAKICPVVGTTTDVLPPHHPTFDPTDKEARCPITNAKVSHHDKDVIHNHPSASSIPDGDEANDATSCPALKNVNTNESVTDATCPVVGPVSATLPPSHPQLTEKEAGAMCPVTNATLKHHKDADLRVHPSVPKDAEAQKCPVVGSAMSP